MGVNRQSFCDPGAPFSTLISIFRGNLITELWIRSQLSIKNMPPICSRNVVMIQCIFVLCLPDDLSYLVILILCLMLCSQFYALSPAHRCPPALSWPLVRVDLASVASTIALAAREICPMVAMFAGLSICSRRGSCIRIPGGRYDGANLPPFGCMKAHHSPVRRNAVH